MPLNRRIVISNSEIASVQSITVPELFPCPHCAARFETAQQRAEHHSQVHLRASAWTPVDVNTGNFGRTDREQGLYPHTLPDEDFGVPELRLFPIDTLEHARNALTRSANNTTRHNGSRIRDIVKERVMQRYGSEIIPPGLSQPAVYRTTVDGLDVEAIVSSDHMQDFLDLSRIAASRTLTCIACNAQDNFKTDFIERTVKCNACQRKVSFEGFLAEHR